MYNSVKTINIYFILFYYSVSSRVEDFLVLRSKPFFTTALEGSIHYGTGCHGAEEAR